MKLFINNKRIRFISDSHKIKRHDYDIVVDATFPVDLNALKGKILITHLNIEKVISLVKMLELEKLASITSVTFWVEDPERAKKVFKKTHKIIKAAGGLVVHEGKVLMIYRLGVWDFPKGKIEESELPAVAAEREILEECGIRCQVVEKICSTWHTYTDKEKKILKKTTWFLLTVAECTALNPQIEEGIEQVEWVSFAQVDNLLATSYESIKYVWKKFNKKYSNQ